MLHKTEASSIVMATEKGEIVIAENRFLVFIGSPFQFHVDNISSGHVTAYGPGLMHGVAGEPATFTIVTKDAGAGMYAAIITSVIYRSLRQLQFYQTKCLLCTDVAVDKH